MKEYVIQFGNHFLQSDDFQTNPKWTDLAHASVHTKEWVEKFVGVARSEENQIMYLMTMTEALQKAAEGRDRDVKSTWLAAFAQMVYDHYTSYTNEGLWCNAHMYYGMGLTVEAAVKRFAKGLKLKRKPKPVVVK